MIVEGAGTAAISGRVDRSGPRIERITGTASFQESSCEFGLAARPR